MAIVTKTRTYNNGDALPANYYNADRDEIIAGVNSIDNAQVSPTAGILESKLLFNGTSGHDHSGGVNGKPVSLAGASIGTIGVSGMTANYPLVINPAGTAVVTRLLGNGDIDAAAGIVESKLTFNAASGHNHDGSDSKLVSALTLDVTGLTPLEHLRINSLGTAVETASIVEGDVTFDPTTGHIHDGVFSTKVPLANVNPVGYTPLNFLRINAGATAVEAVSIPEAAITFAPTGGHAHDGVSSTKVPLTNLDPAGSFPLKALRVNAAGTAVQTTFSPVISGLLGFSSPITVLGTAETTLATGASINSPSVQSVLVVFTVTGKHNVALSPNIIRLRVGGTEWGRITIPTFVTSDMTFTCYAIVTFAIGFGNTFTLTSQNLGGGPTSSFTASRGDVACVVTQWLT
jgi:hypothetical protein